MAQLGLSGVTDAINLVYRDEIAKNFIENASPILRLVQKVADGNSTCTWSVKFRARAAGGAYAPGSDFDTSEIAAHTRDQASLAWANYRESFDIADETIDIVAASGGAEGTNLILTETMDCVGALARYLSTHVYSGSGSSNQLLGLASWVDNQTASPVAGIDPNAVAAWRGNETTHALASLTLEAIRTKAIRPSKDAVRSDAGLVLVGSGTVTDAVKGLFDESADTVKSFNAGGGRFLDLSAAVGQSAMSIDGIPYIEDPFATASTMYCIHVPSLALKYVPIARATGADAVPAVAARMSAILDVEVSEQEAQELIGEMTGMFAPGLVEIGKQGTSSRGIIRSGNVQIACKRRDAHTKLTLT